MRPGKLPTEEAPTFHRCRTGGRMSVTSDGVSHHAHHAESAGLRGLLVRDPYASQLLDGEKIWEIRGRSTHIRGPILIVKSGTGQLFGTADLVRVLGPLELEDLVAAPE